jgi:predicted nucleotidyltransferase
LLLHSELGEKLVSLCLCGSVARGAASPESDIDLLVIVREAKKSYYKMLEPVLQAERTLRETDRFRQFHCSYPAPYLSYLVFSEVEASRNRNIYCDMVDDGIILYDNNHFLQRRLQQVKQRLRELGAERVVLDDGRWFWDLKPDLVPGMTFEL